MAQFEEQMLNKCLKKGNFLGKRTLSLQSYNWKNAIDQHGESDK